MLRSDNTKDYLDGIHTLVDDTSGDPRIKVAVLDSDVDLDHPCFSGSHLKVLQLDSTTESPPLVSDHGTFVSSIIFGSRNCPAKGIAPQCSGLLIPIFLAEAATGLKKCSQLDLARAITLAVEHGAHVISISGGQFSHGDQAEFYLTQAINYCLTRNVLVIAAAGNEGCDCVHVPAAIPGVLAVGAADEFGRPLVHSNWGKLYHEQGILAQGSSLAGATVGGGYSTMSGTSMATAVVAGVAALMLSKQLAWGGSPNPIAVKRALLASALACDLGDGEACLPYLAGRLNISGAIENLWAGLNNRQDYSNQPAGGELTLSSLNQRKGELKMNGENVVNELVGNGEQPNPISSEFADANEESGLEPSACGKCAAAEAIKSGKMDSAKQTFVYALGTVGYDFVNEARRDSFIQSGLARPNDPEAMINYLKNNPEAATALRWTLQQDGTTLYAISPSGPYAYIGFDRLIAALGEQMHGNVERISIPGHIVGNSKLQNGQSVPVIRPELRGMYTWSTASLVDAVVEAGNNDQSVLERTKHEVGNFLERIYYDTRNLGLTPQDRAINYAATNAFQVERVFHAAIKNGMKLDDIEVERSPIARPNSNCWDVKLRFFNPTRRLEQARQVYRFTIDVSDVVPVTVGKVRSWDIY